jgi:glycosyltransferase involved in cell wall biosynthesis
LVPLYQVLSICNNVHGFLEKKDLKPGVDISPVFVLPCKISSGGLATLSRWLGSQVHPPYFIEKAAVTFDRIKPDVLVVFDIYHWYLVQCIRYRKKNSDTRLVIYSETKRWPRNYISQILLKMFIWYVRRCKNSIDTVFVYTEEGQSFWKKYLPEFETHILMAPVRIDIFYPPVQRVWLPDGVLRIIINARYAKYKRHLDIFEAVSRMIKQGYKIEVTCIAYMDSGRDYIETLAHELGIADQITFSGKLTADQLRELNWQHDVLVLPSYNEAIGMVVPEAMACGLPTITSDTVGANSYVLEGVTGSVFKTGDIDELVNALSKYFDANQLQDTGAAARKHICNYTPEKISGQFHSIIFPGD